MANLNCRTSRPLGRRLARRGLSTVEAALIFPLMLIITFGALEYGWMFLKQQQITNIARQAARTAATPNATSGTVTSRVSTMMTDAGMGESGYSLSISGINAIPGQFVTVTISVSYANVTFTNLTTGVLALPAPDTLSAQVVMAKEGP